jgi:hypothetical protein
MLYFTEAISKSSVAINPKHIVAVFTATEGEQKGKTVISIVNGNIAVEDDYLETVGRLNAVE